MNAAEHCLLASPQERFTQTGCAWMLRYALTQKDDADLAIQIIARHSHLWTTEAKKSMVEKLPSSRCESKYYFFHVTSKFLCFLAGAKILRFRQLFSSHRLMLHNICNT
jgi:hypothetical protein